MILPGDLVTVPAPPSLNMGRVLARVEDVDFTKAEPMARVSHIGVPVVAGVHHAETICPVSMLHQANPPILPKHRWPEGQKATLTGFVAS